LTARNVRIRLPHPVCTSSKLRFRKRSTDCSPINSGSVRVEDAHGKPPGPLTPKPSPTSRRTSQGKRLFTDCLHEWKTFLSL
jgi:hypothetical protein